MITGPRISRKDLVLSERDEFQGCSGRPEPVVGFHTVRVLGREAEGRVLRRPEPVWKTTTELDAPGVFSKCSRSLKTRSFRLILGPVIISARDLEVWVIFVAKSEHYRPC